MGLVKVEVNREKKREHQSLWMVIRGFTSLEVCHFVGQQLTTCAVAQGNLQKFNTTALAGRAQQVMLKSRQFVHQWLI